MYVPDLYWVAIIAFGIGVAFTLIFFPGRKNKETKITGVLIVDPADHSLYLSIPSEDTITDIVQHRKDTVTFDVLIKE